MCEQIGKLAQRQGSPEITRAIPLQFLQLKKNQENKVLTELNLRNTHWKTVSGS